MRHRTLGALAALLLGLPPSTAKAHDPNVLWKIVHGQCVLGQQTHDGSAPCVSVSPDGTAVLKDRVGQTQYLLIPTEKISGIESPAILAPGAPNYFAAAWTATALVEQAIGHPLPRDDFALAINSERGRSQNQLHIHVDCIDRTTHTTLVRIADRIGPDWHTLPVRLANHHYRALWIDGQTLGDTNPFHLLADSLPDPASDIGRHTLVLVGAIRHGRPGFILLDGRSGPLTVTLVASDLAHLRLGPGSGEELEDHACAIGH
jgi:CDP-diacylglycerol pyrophosphatase